MRLVKLLRRRAAELSLTSTVRSFRGGVLNMSATIAGSAGLKLEGPPTSSCVGALAPEVVVCAAYGGVT